MSTRRQQNASRKRGLLASLTRWAALAAMLAVGAAAQPTPYVRPHVAGTVELDDGMPFTGPIQVEMRCHGQTIDSDATDAQGLFVLFYSEWSPGPVDYSCVVRAAAPGYETAVAPAFDLPRARTIPGLTLRRKGVWQGDSISAAFLSSPPAARKLFEQAVREMRRGDSADLAAAVAALSQAVAVDPRHAAAWFEIGRVRLAQDDQASARAALSKAIEVDPWFITPYEPLLLIEVSERRWARVAELTDRMIAMNPYLAQARYYRAVAAMGLGEVERARAEAKELALGPEAESYPLRFRLEGFLAEHDEDWAAAAAVYRRYLRMEPEASDATAVSAKIQGWLRQGLIEEPAP